MPALSIFYEGKDRVYPFEKLTIKKAIQLYKNEDYRYLILDWNKFFIARQNELIAEVLDKRPVPVFMASYIPFSMLYCGDKEIAKKLTAHRIEVYDLRDIFEKSPQRNNQ